RAADPVVGLLGGGVGRGARLCGRVVLAPGRDTGDMSATDLLLVPTGQPDERLPTAGAGPTNFGWWGMVLFIAVEATLFALLLASYFYVRFRSGPVWPPDGIEDPKLALVLVMSAVLWSSSLPVHLAHSAIKRGHVGAMRVCLALGFVLGAAFLALQCAVEYPDILR